MTIVRVFEYLVDIIKYWGKELSYYKSWKLVPKPYIITILMKVLGKILNIYFLKIQTKQIELEKATCIRKT